MKPFQFKFFQVDQRDDVHKVGTDAMLLGALADADQPRSILDVGTGTGAIALMMAQRYPDAVVTGIDVQSQAVQLADKNFSNSAFSDRLKAEKKAIEACNARECYDLIVSNPPFFSAAYHSPSTFRNVARHDAQFSFELFFSKVSQLLKRAGNCTLIIPADQKVHVEQKARNHGLKAGSERCINGKPDRPVRFILSFVHERSKQAFQELPPLTIRDKDGQYTADYKRCTAQFHGKKI
ncbi:MAG: tRNA1(Val) (adenine(37)-N6)-methyltransferase [Bacteroidota bacterium]